MRRRPSRSSSRLGESGGEQGFWPSYADMMSAVALILFFLMLLSYLQNLVTGNDLQNTQELLSLTQSQVKDAESQLSLLTDDLKLKQNELEQYALQIVEQTDTIDAQKDLIANQESYLLSANQELTDMRNQMQTIAVLRLSILEQIKDSIVEVMGDESKVSIGDNGNIILSEGVFFDLGSSAIKPESQAVLDELILVFQNFLANGDNAKYVDSIVISGHTDITGSSSENRALSTDRANSVLSYLLSGRSAALDAYSQYFCAAGYGATRPVASNDTEPGRAANRRIEISMILKDETVLDIVDQYLAMELPATEASPSQSVSPSPSVRPSPAVSPSPSVSPTPSSKPIYFG